MNKLDSLFPELPKIEGYWRAVYLEPIVGSGEKIAIAAVAVDGNKFSVIQSVRDELLDCLYGQQADNMRSMIKWILSSLQSELKLSNSLADWVSPISGVFIGDVVAARGNNLDEILKQAVRFSASLSSLSLDADRADDDEQPRRYSEHWSRSISAAMKLIEPSLIKYFGQKVKLGEANVETSFGFIHGEYSANFGLLVPSRLTSSLNNVKAKLFDLETFKKSSLFMKPREFEIIIGAPSLQDPTLTETAVNKLKENFLLLEELAAAEDIGLFKAENAEDAAIYIRDKLAA